MKRCNLYLDEETIQMLKDLSKDLFGKENISQAIRYMARLNAKENAPSNQGADFTKSQD